VIDIAAGVTSATHSLSTAQSLENRRNNKVEEAEIEEKREGPDSDVACQIPDSAVFNCGIEESAREILKVLYENILPCFTLQTQAMLPKFNGAWAACCRYARIIMYCPGLLRSYRWE
jgi:hypothetical protein